MFLNKWLYENITIEVSALCAEIEASNMIVSCASLVDSLVDINVWWRSIQRIEDTRAFHDHLATSGILQWKFG